MSGDEEYAGCKQCEWLNKKLDVASDRLAKLEDRNSEAIKIIMAVVGNGLLEGDMWEKLKNRAMYFYSNEALRSLEEGREGR